MQNKKIPVDCYDRVCGYFSSSANWNKGKAEERRILKRFDANKFLKEVQEYVAVSV